MAADLLLEEVKQVFREAARERPKQGTIVKVLTKLDELDLDGLIRILQWIADTYHSQCITIERWEEGWRVFFGCVDYEEEPENIWEAMDSVEPSPTLKEALVVAVQAGGLRA